MKKIFLIAFIFISTFANAQNVLDKLPEIDGKIAYDQIIYLPGKTQNFIFSAANKWILDTFSEKAGRILSEDKDQGQIFAEGKFKLEDQESNFFNPAFDYTYKFKIQIDCKDGIYRIQLYNMLRYTGRPSKDETLDDLTLFNFDLSRTKSKVPHQNAYKLDAQFKAIIQSLVNAVNKAVADGF